MAHPDVSAEIDTNGVAEIMLVGPGRTPGCGVFKGIEELLPSRCGFFTSEGLKLRQYWHLKDREHRDTLDQTVEKVRGLVIDAIERQLVSDVNIGTFLSGGLDSSIISSVANRWFRARNKELQTFSVDYRDNEQYFKANKFQIDSDHAFAQQMSGYLRTNHHRIVVDTEDLVEALYTAVDARDLPGMADVDSSLLIFCREVRNHITVALSGECADEIFGGYPWYRDRTIRERNGFPWAQSTDYRTDFLTPEFASKIDSHSFVDRRYRKTVAESSILPGTNSVERRMKEMMNLNLWWFMQTLLDRKDRMSMYNGLEVRVPFCDYRIVEYLYQVPWEMKDFDDREKGLLRIAFRGLLPDEILWRRKSPYPKTHHPAYLKAVSEKLRDVISDPAAPVLRIARKEALEALLETDNPILWYGQLMTAPQTIAYFLQLNYWLEKYRVRIV